MPKFPITDTKLYVPVVTLSTEDNAKLHKQLKSGFKRKINWNKRLSKRTMQAPKHYEDYLIDTSLRLVNRLFTHHVNILGSEQVTRNIFFQL